MKKIIGLMALTLAFSSQSFALVRELALCTTSDGQYTVSISDNQGTGFIKKSHVIATVSDAKGTVASYKAEKFHGVQSISFGRSKYLDSASAGKEFLLQGPSTNFRHFSLSVEMNVGQNSGKIVDDDLSCSVFNGRVLQNP